MGRADVWVLLDWHRDVLFESSVRAGCIDLDGCGVVDVLPRCVCYSPDCLSTNPR